MISNGKSAQKADRCKLDCFENKFSRNDNAVASLRTAKRQSSPAVGVRAYAPPHGEGLPEAPALAALLARS